MLARFREQFRALTGNSPFVWQELLFQRFLEDVIPPQVNVPPGCGKTALMQVWLLALAVQAGRGTPLLPRRLVWVVHNRAVVDQATTEANNIASLIQKPPVELQPVADALRTLCAVRAAQPLAVSTLRGERADNRQWSDDPSRPAIIVGTVDMIGSRLLFRGYGDSRRWRARHAGILGLDTLAVNDEAHLTPAFASLLEAVRKIQREGPENRRALHFLRLSATPRDHAEGFPADLAADLPNTEFRRRVEAPKRLETCPAADTKSARSELIARAVAPGAARTIVYVQQPEEAARIAEEIGKKASPDRVITLTGTMRGHERDRLCSDLVFQRFMERTPGNGPPAWLVATSAGEVGINIDAERVVSELATADHLLQRFGRLNRFGQGQGEAHVVWNVKPPKGGFDERLAATREYLAGLPEKDGGRDVSHAALWNHRPGQDANSPVWAPPPLLPGVLEAWALTSIDQREWSRRPEVGPWLHGAEPEPPETQVAWREDVEWLASPDLDAGEIEEALDAHPVLARERLRLPTHWLQEERIEGLRAMCGEKRVIVVAADGSAESKILESIKEEDLAYALLLLPPGVGRLSGGMFETGPPGEDCEYDVADWEPDPRAAPRRARYLARTGDDGQTWMHRLGAKNAVPEPLGGEPTLAALQEFAKRHGWVLRHRTKLPSRDETDQRGDWLVYFAARQERKREEFAYWPKHTEAVVRVAGELAVKLGFEGVEAEALKLAAELHDRGKLREVWQRAAGNPEAVDKPVEKAPFVNWKTMAGYRHELGSLTECEHEIEKRGVNGGVRDLALHLVACHHGWARPHFRENAADRTRLLDSRDAARNAMLRFARLQDRYGVWGLAYIEAVFCAADALASQAEGREAGDD